MTTQKTRISQITYNPARRCFEASVTLFDGEQAYTYPISMPAPLDSAYSDISKAVLERARRKHEKALGPIRSTRLAEDALAMPIVLPPSVREATVGLWDRLLNHRAA
ncbi:hypothetical protein ATO6_05100 [Oceanicola sp. 22II-s10i]|uniref:hypothetical protein n=1 Tax=Oceanicola sp. 22II-s10i TaxID=1317116 RepID=UPI000B526D14|nr:hypothetical protein [Oceanicola sp. 22II-s10i]OWU86219.1 hypothetical protein ATO6_05100 [Oceanicola sp. 22II-s10i]